MSTDSVTIAVTVSVNVKYASSNDHDPAIGISDGRSFNGYKVPDNAASPCDHFEGDSSTDLLILLWSRCNIPTLFQ